MKKFRIPLAAAALFLLAALCFFFFSPTNVYEAIPKSAVAIITVNDWSKFNNQLGKTDNGSDLKKTDAIRKLTDEISEMEGLASSDKSLQEMIASGKTVASAHLTSADGFDYLFITAVNSFDENVITNHIQQMKTVKDVNVRIFKNQKVTDIQLKDGRQITFAKLKGIFAFSFTSFLTESAVSALLSGDNVQHDKNFVTIYKKQSLTGDLNLFINFKKAGVILPLSIRQEKTALLNDVTLFSTWGAYSVTITDDEIKLNGIALAGEKNMHTASRSFTDNELWGSIPDNAAYVNIGLNPLNNTEKKNQAEKEKAPASYFTDWTGEARAFITMEPLNEDFTSQNVFLIQVKDKGKAIADLKKLMAMDAGTTQAIDTFLSAEIFNLKSGSAINEVFGSSLTGFKEGFFTIHNKLGIFCNDLDALKFVLEKASKGETLDKDAKFKSAITGQPDASNGMLYIDPSRSDLLLKGLTKENSTLRNYISQFSSVIAGFNTADDCIHTTIVLKTGTENKTTGGLLWKTKLQSTSGFPPQIVFNSSGEKEIFTQDTSNNIYLISKSGEILFSKNIGEKIMGQVFQLDYYNNGKLQCIFNTANHVYIIDRLGNYVASYPLRLAYSATAGLTLVNEGKTYRYYIPCSNGAIYGYESTGKPLAGWSPRGNTGNITKTLLHPKNQKAGFLVAFNNSGKLMLFDIKGTLKWSVDNLPVTRQNFSLVNTRTGFTLLNASGNQLVEISSDGNDNIHPLIDSAYSFIATATSDSTYQYFFSNSNEVRAYYGTDEFINAISLKNGSIAGIDIVTIGETKYLRVVDEASKKAFIYTMDLTKIAEYSITDPTSFIIADLFGGKQIIGVRPEKEPCISCYRIK